MIPDFIDIGSPAPWPVLPPGIHSASLNEIGARFAQTPHRAWLYGGFVRAATSLQTAGCRAIYLDGSFVTANPHPGDFDGCWDLTDVDPGLIDPILLDFADKRAAQKKKFFGEMFPISPSDRGFLHFFQTEKFSGLAKGVILVSQTQKGATL